MPTLTFAKDFNWPLGPGKHAWYRAGRTYLKVATDVASAAEAKGVLAAEAADGASDVPASDVVAVADRPVTEAVVPPAAPAEAPVEVSADPSTDAAAETH